MQDHNEADNRIEAVLAEAGNRQPQLPLGFTATVMRGVHAVQGGLSPWRRWRRARRATNFSLAAGVDTGHSDQRRPVAATEGDNVGKKILWAVTGVGAVAAVSMFFLGIPPVGDGTEGTIGAAKRFQGATLTDKDVVVGPMDVQQFLQSDTFDRIMKNEAARNFLIRASQDLELQKTLSDPAIVRAFADVEFSKVFFNAEFQRAFADVEFRQRLADVELRQKFANAEFQKVFMNAEFQRVFMNAEFQKVFLNVEFQRALAEPAFQQAFRIPGLMQALSAPAFQQALITR